jgi:acid phosphatase (class A)
VKTIPIRLTFLLVLGLAGVLPLRAAENRLVYLSASSLDATQLLAPPPVAGSAEEAAEMENTFRVYAAASPDEHARAIDEVNLTVFHFAPVIGSGFTPENCPKTAALFGQVHTEARVIAKGGKDHWRRIRPYHLDPVRFSNPVEHEPRTDYCYPSGHATRGMAYALLLAEIFPEKRDALFAKGYETGWLRVKGGVHFPTDVYAGRVLGQAFARALLANASFQKDLGAVKEELARLRKP